MRKLLIVYYSWSNGNTERIAKELQSATEADIARIETVAFVMPSSLVYIFWYAGKQRRAICRP